MGFGHSDSFTSRTNYPTFIGDDGYIMAEIPGDSALNSVNRNYDLNYRPFETRDLDFVRIPKEENLISIETVDFFEFERVFQCTRPELLHLSNPLTLLTII